MLLGSTSVKPVRRMLMKLMACVNSVEQCNIDNTYAAKLGITSSSVDCIIIFFVPNTTQEEIFAYIVQKDW